MRYSAIHKRATRARILKAAAHQLLARGLAGASVARVMGQAGLTHGGFYTHFASKEALIKEALDSVMADRRAALMTGLDEVEGEERLVQVIGRYICRRHRDNPAEGCAIPALAGEVARAGPKLRRSFGRGLRALAAEFARGIPGNAGSRAAPNDTAPCDESRARAGADLGAHERALAILALCAGAVMLARAVNDDALSSDILRACRRFALAGGSG